MTKAMRSFPKGLSREERGKLFCIEAKLCSGKSKNKADAERACNENPPAPRIKGGGRRGINAESIASCLLPKLSEVSSLSTQQLANWISECSGKGGTKIKKPMSQKRWINRCVADGIVNGTFAESVRLHKECGKQWKEQQNNVQA